MKAKILSLVGFSTIQHSLRTEILAGLTTFTSMSYILALMPVMFAPLAEKGYPMDSLVTATTLSAIIGTLLMAFLAKRPFGQAPGLALNLFFVETVCISLGYSWQFALTAVFIEGLLFVLLCMSNLRQLIFGLLAEGTIFNHIHTLVNPNSLLFLLGLLLGGAFTVMRIRGGLLLSIIIVTIAGIPAGVTQIPDSLFSLPTSPAPLFCQFSWEELLTPDLWVCVLTMLFFDIFDTLGSVVGLMANAGHIRKNGRIPHMRSIMLSDAIATMTGACLGCSTVTTYVESATGVAEGGRTGLTALVIALCFILSLFMAPLFLAIPSAATAPIMVMAGFYLFGSVRRIELSKPVETIPAFLTILLMPATGSITDGIIIGLFTYVAFSFIENGLNWIRRRSTQQPLE